MPKVAPIQSDFSSGEFSGLVSSQVSLERYKKALARCLNYVSPSQGALIRRPGTKFVAEVKDSTKSTRLVNFEFSITQAYIIEFGDQYLRFYKDDAQILSGPPYEIATPYLEADLFQLKFAQSADVLYIVHPNYAPRKLSRTGHTAWTLTVIDFLDGPYLNTNTTATTLTPSATGPGAGITLTASSIVGINGGVGFVATDIGRLVRMFSGAFTLWGYAKITGWTSSTVVTVTVINAFGTATAHQIWRLGVFSVTTGYPATVTFHEDRLVLAGVPNSPQRLDASNVGDYENFAPSTVSNVIIDSHAWAFTLNSEDVNVIRWVKSDEKALLIGTVKGEWLMRPSAQSEAITPTNVVAKQSTSYGSADIQPVKVGKSIMYVQRSKRRLRELTFIFDVDGFQADNLNVLADHACQSGVVEMAYQREPYPIIWVVREDGVLANLNYERTVESLRAGWNRQKIGGFSDSSQNSAKVESIAVIPSPDGSYDELWMIVQRWINGAIKRYVEVMVDYFNDEDEVKDSFFVDCGLTYDDPKTITAISLGAFIEITSAAHGFSDGDKILISDVVGTTELNTNSYYVSNVTANTFRLRDVSNNYIDGTAFTPYITGGFAREYVSVISGLSHLEGETVSVLADGAARPDVVVTAGAVTLATVATTIHIGFHAKTQGQMLRPEAGSANGTSFGKTRRSHRAGIDFYRSVGLYVGFDFNNLSPIIFRKASDPTSRAVPLFTGIKTFEPECDYGFETQLCWEQREPLPSVIRAVMPQLDTEDAL